jgi:hypothetical protein
VPTPNAQMTTSLIRYNEIAIVNGQRAVSLELDPPVSKGSYPTAEKSFSCFPPSNYSNVSQRHLAPQELHVKNPGGLFIGGLDADLYRSNIRLSG